MRNNIQKWYNKKIIIAESQAKNSKRKIISQKDKLNPLFYRKQ